jgi:hypothetical protein
LSTLCAGCCLLEALKRSSTALCWRLIARSGAGFGPDMDNWLKLFPDDRLKDRTWEATV